MKKIDAPLSKKEWAEQANIKRLKQVIESVNNNTRVWDEELCRIIPQSAKCLEIGCGTGITSLWLAKNGRVATALDYTTESIELVNAAAEQLNINIKTVCCDATVSLPFAENEYDYVFQCGLLEHFDTEKQIELLKEWGMYTTNMISVIPNASSLAYRIGKEIMEKEGTWKWGYEHSKKSMVKEFLEVGFKDIKEYSIGSEWAMRFLPQDHYLRLTIQKLLDEGFCLDEIMQGYLLVTIGRH